ncbi:MAG: DUF2784 domain-containing protein [bacterium]|nr:DUF2784 domain-containing protein [bacterium]
MLQASACGGFAVFLGKERVFRAPIGLCAFRAANVLQWGKELSEAQGDMRQFLLQAADIFFLIFHGVLTAFNALGWAWRGTRRWHLVTMALTGLSWVGLGYWYGWGFCICTEWHWQVREALGRPIPFDSYISFLLYEITGCAFDEKLVSRATLAVYVGSWVLTIWLNVRDWRKRGAARLPASAS